MREEIENILDDEKAFDWFAYGDKRAADELEILFLEKQIGLLNKIANEESEIDTADAVYRELKTLQSQLNQLTTK